MLTLTINPLVPEAHLIFKKGLLKTGSSRIISFENSLEIWQCFQQKTNVLSKKTTL